MHFSAAFITFFTAASVAFAQQKPPSAQEAEEMARALYGDNASVFKTLADYYSTHSFTTGTQLLSWMSKIDKYETQTAFDGNNQDMSPAEAMSLWNEAFSDFPAEDYSNLIEQYFPTSILGTNGIAAVMPSITAFSTPTGFADSSKSDTADKSKTTDSESHSATPGASASRSRAVESSAVSADTTSSSPSTTIAITTVVTSQETSTTEQTVSASSAKETTSAVSSANGANTIGYCGATFIGLFGAIVGLNVF
jgi:cobalamin biosynthesis Mg chelatase CobN